MIPANMRKAGMATSSRKGKKNARSDWKKGDGVGLGLGLGVGVEFRQG